MAHLPTWFDPEPAIAAPVIEQATIEYLAACEACGWFGRARVSNLAALADYDRHAELTSHAIALVMATAAPDDGDGDDD